MKVAVLEYLSGGELQEDGNSPSLFNEGLAMLSALAIDLLQCGHEVHTCLNTNVAFRSAKDAQFALFATHEATLNNSILGGLNVHHIDQNYADTAWAERWIEVALHCDQTIVIAPEIHQQLHRIVDKLRSAGATVVASSEAFLQATSDKLTTANLFIDAHVPHPATQTLSQYRLSMDRLDNKNQELAVTLKRRDGAGCCDMKVFTSQQKLTEWLKNKESQNLMGDEWIVQEWLAGRPASMALLTGDDWTLLGAVEQLEKLASQVRVALPSGAAGWIGIDFLVPDESVGSKDLIVIEVNPRLTTSYLGYRKWYGYQLADALLGNVSFSDLKLAMNQQRITFDAS